MMKAGTDTRYKTPLDGSFYDTRAGNLRNGLLNIPRTLMFLMKVLSQGL